MILSNYLLDIKEMQRKMSKDELADFLRSAHNVPIAAIDRFIVMQNRQAVNVQNPSLLAKNLEHLIGTDHFEERILQLKSSIHTLTEQIEACHGDVSLIEEEREQLLPQVQKWERQDGRKLLFQAQATEKKLRRNLEDHHKHLKDLNKSLEHLKLQVVKAESRLNELFKKQEAERKRLSTLHEEMKHLEKLVTVTLAENVSTIDEKARVTQELARLEGELARKNTAVLPALKGELTDLEVRLSAVQHQKERAATSEDDRFRRFDEAASDLRTCFGGSFFGRIQDVAAAPQEFLTAVNAVLFSSMNLSSSFITEDRHTASQVLEYFKANRIGLASCDILAELPDPRPLSAISLGPHATPLASKVHSFDKFQPIVNKYFGNWVVVSNSLQAVRILESAEARRMKPFNIVTLSGEIFKKVRSGTPAFISERSDVRKRRSRIQYLEARLLDLLEEETSWDPKRESGEVVARVEATKEKLERLNSEAKAVEDESKNLEHEREALQRRQLEANKAVSSAIRDLEKVRLEKSKTEEELADLLAERAMAAEKLARLEQALVCVPEIPPTKRQKPQGDPDTDDRDRVNAPDPAESEDSDTETLADRLTKLAEEEEELANMKRSIDPDALQRDVCCRKTLATTSQRLEKLSLELQSAISQRDSLENQRFEAFVSTMTQVNQQLSSIYRKLTRHGDAYLSYTEDKSVLFADGVSLLVRPDRHKWRNFSTLSGGQQALAALALSFSLQAVFPSPFYFFDEIDGSLDTKNARLIAEYIREQNTAQYIVVSHKPEVYELARTLVGVYQDKQSSASLTVQL
ncbi:Putative acetylglucosaminyltransferase EXT1 [Klebsormidium nitens]|uniref:Putative acetylglucosaminyltransferase EXT1 n=1 Tax=Klebsormidium nitens TaxID=105231 RepID=A0A1Y1IIR7_KLENI|nr:Putative acetylglucosaminyltransferase EXT1 [Klebsormidium nitens]|eukprot:GAQ89011.1 Putative acetylglucosaminyltransferase EXT1 [Klebsormidium nitens]